MAPSMQECARGQVAEPADEEEVLVVRNTFLDFSGPKTRLRRAKTWSPDYSVVDEPHTPCGYSPVTSDPHGMHLQAESSEPFEPHAFRSETSEGSRPSTANSETPRELGTRKPYELADPQQAELSESESSEGLCHSNGNSEPLFQFQFPLHLCNSETSFKPDEFASSQCGHLSLTAGQHHCLESEEALYGGSEPSGSQKKTHEVQPTRCPLECEGYEAPTPRYPTTGNLGTPHELGTCMPCKFLNSSKGCLKGPDCEFCHFPHARKSRPRPGKRGRQQCREMHRMVEAAFDHDPEQKAQVIAELTKNNEYFGRLARWGPKGVSTRSSTREWGPEGVSTRSSTRECCPEGVSARSGTRDWGPEETRSTSGTMRGEFDIVVRSWPLSSWNERV